MNLHVVSPWSIVGLVCAGLITYIVAVYLHERDASRWKARAIVIALGFAGAVASFIGSYSASSKLDHLTAPRTIDDASRASLVSELAKYPGVVFDVSSANDPESIELLNVIESVLVTAGWKEQGFSANPIILQRPGQPNAGIIASSGVEIDLPVTHRYDWASAATTLGKGLTQAGLQGVAVHYDPGDRGQALHLRVGYKPQR